MNNLIGISKLGAKALSRIVKDVLVKLRDPEKLNEYFNGIRENSAEANYILSLLSFNPKLRKQRNSVFGHFDELHDRIAGRRGNFNELLKKAKQNKKNSQGYNFKIGVSRYNFFCLGEIVNFCGKDILGYKEDIFLPVFNAFPVDKILSNFGNYLKEIKEQAHGINIELILFDSDLIKILQLVQFHAQRGKISHKELVRLLGVISEHAFIGPQAIVFDPFHRCNIKCKHCFVHNPLIHHPQEFLDRKFDYDIFKGIIDDAAELMVDGIILQGDGEPLLYDKFFDMLRYARSKDIGVLFFTNGSLIGEKEAREIVDLGIREIYCSFPAGTARTYQAVTTSAGEDIFHNIVRNLKRLVEIKNRIKNRQPRLVMTHVIHKLNYNELIDMAKVDVEIGADAARFYLIRLDNNNKHLKLNEEELRVIKRDLPVAADIFKQNNIDFVDNIKFQLGHYDKDTGAWSKDIFLKEGCTIGWYFCLIPALYDVSMCCHLRTTGDLSKKTFKELWNSREYRRFRIKAKFLKSNKDFTFLNGVKLYDEHCEHCDNHQTLLTNFDNLRKLGLYQFMK